MGMMGVPTYDPAGIAKDGLMFVKELLIDLQAQGGVPRAQQSRPGGDVGHFQYWHRSCMVSQKGSDVVSEGSREWPNVFCDPWEQRLLGGVLFHACRWWQWMVKLK